MIDRDSGIPYYRQLMDNMVRHIEDGVWRKGQQIPPEGELGAIYQVNRHTVRHAVIELCHLGVLQKVRGRGTFVTAAATDHLEYRITKQNRFTENILQAGRLPGTKLLRAAQTEAPLKVAGKLSLEPGEDVYLLEILRLVNTQPFLLSMMFLPVKHLPGFMAHTTHFSSLFAILEHVYGIRPVRANCHFIAALPDPQEAGALKIPAGVPVLRTESLLKTQDGIPIQFAVSCYRGDLARISVDW